MGTGTRLHRIMFNLMYRLGKTPWDGHRLPARLLELAGSEPPGRAIDLGCGTGDIAVHLARAGWEVTAVDFVEHPLQAGRRKAADAGVAVRFLRADATALAEAGVAGPFSLLVDSGLLHGLTEPGRAAYVAELNRIAAPDARLILCGFAPGERRGPRGVDSDEIRRRFGPGWDVRGGEPEAGLSSNPADPIHVYELVRA